MKTVWVFVLFGIAFSHVTHALEIAIIDQGINTIKTNKGVFYNPLCLGGGEKWYTHTGVLSNNTYGVHDDIREGNHVGIASVSLCKNDHFSTTFGGANTPRYRSLPPYGKSQNGAQDTYKEMVLLGKDFLSRKYFNAPYQNIAFGAGLRHGTDVANAAYDFDNGVRRKMIQVYHINSKRTNSESCNAVPTSTMTQNTGVIGDIDIILNAFQRIIDNPDGVDAINLSIVLRQPYCLRIQNNLVPDECEFSTGQGEVDALRALGIPLVVGLENIDIDKDEETWPACLPGVIKVGAENDNNNIQNGGIGIGAMDVDFYAKNEVNENKVNGFKVAGNSLAAPRIATAYAMLKTAVPNSTVDQRTEALNLAHTRTNNYRFNNKDYTRRYVKKTDIPQAIIELRELVRGNIDNIFFEDPNQYGPIYGDNLANYTFEINFNELIGSSSIAASSKVSSGTTALSAAMASVSSVRDVVLSFDAKMASNSFDSNGIDVFINAIKRASTGWFYNDERSYTFTFNRKYFNSGVNTIILQSSLIQYNRPWGISNIKAEFTPVVPLTLNQIDTNEYGSEETPERPTGMRASFELGSVDNDVLFSVNGWSIGDSTEVAVFLNGTAYGYLKAGLYLEYGSTDIFTFNKADLIVGNNFIEFVQKDNATFWGVKNLHLQIARPDLVISELKILDQNLKAGIPFEVLAKVKNIGAGIASETTLRFFVSNDENITTSDSLIGAVNVSNLVPNQTQSMTASLQSSQINQGKFLGACVVSVISELNTSNNCSGTIPLKKNVVVAPIIMLLLGD